MCGKHHKTRKKNPSTGQAGDFCRPVQPACVHACLVCHYHAQAVVLQGQEAVERGGSERPVNGIESPAATGSPGRVVECHMSHVTLQCALHVSALFSMQREALTQQDLRAELQKSKERERALEEQLAKVEAENKALRHLCACFFAPQLVT